MAKNLVIVESPAKAKTINKILGKDFDVTASMGHLRDLPSSKLGVDVENNFEPHYIVIYKRRKQAKKLQEDARGREAIYLAPDPDREGEAISWHIAKLLRDDDEAQAKKRAKLEEKRKARKKTSTSSKKSAKAKTDEVPVRKIYRIAFDEITSQAVKHAIEHPQDINLKKVDAQQARRILDRLVGYSLSPLLWKKIGRGLSAGRVQSVALRLIVDREREIEAFVPMEYWTIEAQFRKGSGEPAFKARLDKVDGKKADIKTQDDAESLAKEMKQLSCVVDGVERKEQKRYHKPPFTTSTMQQEAFHKLGFSSSRTMRIAQQLYEGIEIGGEGSIGLITYMRTDSVRIADEALKAVRNIIPEKYGAKYLHPDIRVYKSRKRAQEAHEAIRPTNAGRSPEDIKEFLTKEQFSLYQLLWQRFVASQMADAVDRIVTAHIKAGRFQLKSTGRTNLFAGWTKAYQEIDEEDTDEAQPSTAIV